MNINLEPIDKTNEETIIEKENNLLKKILITLLIIIIIIFFLIVYSRYKATSGLKIYEYKITNQKLPNSFHGVKIVHFSDIHFKNTVNIKYLNNIVNEINKINPDIVIFTGDLGNINNDDKQEIITSLSSINYTIGKYAIKGESDNELFDEIFKNSGFTNLNNTYKYIYNNDNTPILISNIQENYDGFSILLLHEPDKIDEYNSFQLVLAGHSHNGQINIPYIKQILLPEGAKKYYDKHYQVNDMQLYISSGIGTTNFKYRFNNKPSINLYRLTK